ncbi:hypothetical protein [Nostoc sp. ATCC 53789]|uniref:hypothetical protein n=1 Tax=Nostoc sp. ATCC 53789 TaxID=76335 RepID=UPI0011BE7D8F|nr:hypothetical protein [Nostoc sp. ATCC 53789]QHG16006.1 hypothetical protein GJB62_08460 [Nostoc sp. ATCC 53789]
MSAKSLADKNDEKLHPLVDGVFGHEECGMAKKLPMPNAPSDGATIPLHLQGDGVSRRFR